MKHLTQSEYQSLPEHEQCNWKEQWACRPFGDIEFTLLPSEPNDNAKENYDVQLIYIPITPNLAETLFNAEMPDKTKDSIIARNSSFDRDILPDLYKYISESMDMLAKHKVKTIIDIVEAEINGCSERFSLKRSVLLDLLTKLKEIK